MSLKTLGAFIKQRRERLGYASRTDFENRYHFGNGTIANYENGWRRPSTDMVKRLADAFSVRPGLLTDLMFGVLDLAEAERIAATDSQAEMSERERWIRLPPNLKPQDIEEIKEYIKFKSQRNLNP